MTQQFHKYNLLHSLFKAEGSKRWLNMDDNNINLIFEYAIEYILYNARRYAMDNRHFKMDNVKKLREKKNMTQTRLSVKIEALQEIISHY